MSVILVPVNFTLQCHNAYSYALQFAATANLDVLLVHYYSDKINPEKPLSYMQGDVIHDSYLKKLERFAVPAGEGFDYPLAEPPAGVNLYFETEKVISVTGAILKRARQNDVELVVMATRSSNGFLDKWLGSTSTTISESCNRPVFLIPPGARYYPIKRIVVANHHETAEPYPLWQIKILKKFTGAEVHFVHVQQPDNVLHKKFVPWRLMEFLHANNKSEEADFKVIEVDEKNIANGLVNYADHVNAQLTVVVNRVRSHWRAVLYPGVTQKVALRTHQPILVLHTDIAWETKQSNTRHQVNATC